MNAETDGWRPARALRAVALGCAVCLLALCGLGSSPSDARAAAAGDKEAPAKSAGGKAKKDPSINIEAGKLDYFDKEQKLVYTGDVVAVQGDTTLKTPLLVVYLTPKEP